MMTSSYNNEISTDDDNQVVVHTGKISYQNLKYFKSYEKKNLPQGVRGRGGGAELKIGGDAIIYVHILSL